MKKNLILKIEDTITGFTLAEVLITLVIIGVIAALTIPALLQNIQNAQLKAAWKESYSILESATKRIMIDNSGDVTNICNIWDHNCLRDLYLHYLSYTKKCDNNQALGNCWPTLIRRESRSYYENAWNPGASGAVLNNGSLLHFIFEQPACNGTEGTSINNECGYIEVDVNGFKGPNAFGKDIFEVWFLKNGIAPVGKLDDGYETDCDTGALFGLGCSAMYLKQ